MRVALASLALVAILVAGCTSPDFRTLAMNAPALLAADAGPDGQMRSQTGSITMSADIPGTEEGITLTMNFELQILQEGAYLATMTTAPMQMGDETIGGMSFVIFCSPAKLVVSGTMPGMPRGDQVLANPLGRCPTDPQETANLSQEELDEQTAAVFKALGMGGTPDLTFKAVEVESSGNVAVYEYTLSSDVAGIDVGMVLTTRAHLEGSRIVRMDITGTADASGDAGGSPMSMHMDITGSLAFAYGQRDPIPARYA